MGVWFGIWKPFKFRKGGRNHPPPLNMESNQQIFFLLLQPVNTASSLWFLYLQCFVKTFSTYGKMNIWSLSLLNSEWSCRNLSIWRNISNRKWRSYLFTFNEKETAAKQGRERGEKGRMKESRQKKRCIWGVGERCLERQTKRRATVGSISKGIFLKELCFPTLQLSKEFTLLISAFTLFLYIVFSPSSLDWNWLQNGINVDQTLLRLTT